VPQPDARGPTGRGGEGHLKDKSHRMGAKRVEPKKIGVTPPAKGAEKKRGTTKIQTHSRASNTKRELEESRNYKSFIRRANC